MQEIIVCKNIHALRLEVLGTREASTTYLYALPDKPHFSKFYRSFFILKGIVKLRFYTSHYSFESIELLKQSFYHEKKSCNASTLPLHKHSFIGTSTHENCC